MEEIFQKAQALEKQAWKVVEETNLLDIWQSVGATINAVGSLKMGLLMNHRDIDFHIYTDPFILSESFSAIARLAENPRIRTINYANLLDAEDKCIEWHAFYEVREGELWQIDMIHILSDSPYAGHFEKVAERISQVLTPKTRQAVLCIKDAMPKDKKVMGIEIYQAVIRDGVRDITSFWQWKEKNSSGGIITWMP
ncbi:MAG: phosphoglycerate mutase family protein [Desulfatibacillum sp.]|nr:phosphoglycerate mutase family protein [Desulfatibacillum sp.]